MNDDNPSNEKDFYFENGLMVMTESYHLKRGICCGSRCRHCPFNYENVKENKEKPSQNIDDKE